ncbi:MAG TPA: 1,4-alpha-glucan branching protein GlgB [Myxococcota bacterium]|nr:1,4-alpha-glucan branching protein GlgB [Myxococcota bacterium]
MSDRGHGLLDAQDLYLFNEGSHLRLWEKLGAHPHRQDGVDGVFFAVWAPNAERVSAIGDWNGWDPAAHPLRPVGGSGIWAGFVPGISRGARYKYRVEAHGGAFRVDKTDPFAFHCEVSPRTASLVWTLEYEWGDQAWLESRAGRNSLHAPMTTYELHVGSWRRVPEQGHRSLSYRELAERLPEYAVEMGFTHVELLPVMEHPFYGSWGYQTTGYFAPTSRYGTPQDLMFLVDRLHQAGVGVIFDWVPSHFPTDEHGLGYFDGTHLYEHGDPRQGIHPDWHSFVFNYGRHEVRSFLLSSAMYWLSQYHADGLRVDAVASMLYLDYSRRPGEWVPNAFGGRENLEALEFVRRLNADAYALEPAVQTIAEESTAWPMVSRPTSAGGLGFGLKWDMGWMHDALEYFAHDPVHRRFHHGNLTFRMLYAFTENFVLPLSHDEVVHGKRALLAKLPGDEWQRFANLRALYGYMFTQPGKKLLFMGDEIGDTREWDHESSVDWGLLERERHRGLQRFVRDLNTLYRGEPALHARDCEAAGFEWVDCNDAEQSTLAYLRHGGTPRRTVLVVCNFTPVLREGFRVGVPVAGFWRELLNGDATLYGGSGAGNLGGVRTEPVPWHGRLQSLRIRLPPLAVAVFRPEGD